MTEIALRPPPLPDAMAMAWPAADSNLDVAPAAGDADASQPFSQALATAMAKPQVAPNESGGTTADAAVSDAPTDPAAGSAVADPTAVQSVVTLAAVAWPWMAAAPVQPTTPTIDAVATQSGTASGAPIVAAVASLAPTTPNGTGIAGTQQAELPASTPVAPQVPVAPAAAGLTGPLAQGLGAASTASSGTPAPLVAQAPTPIQTPAPTHLSAPVSVQAQGPGTSDTQAPSSGATASSTTGSAPAMPQAAAIVSAAAGASVEPARPAPGRTTATATAAATAPSDPGGTTGTDAAAESPEPQGLLPAHGKPSAQTAQAAPKSSAGGAATGADAATTPVAPTTDAGAAPATDPSGGAATVQAPGSAPAGSTEPAGSATRLPAGEVLAAQIVPRILHAVADGRSTIAVSLQPEELGRVELRLEVRSGGEVAVAIHAHRSDTLDLLQRNAPALERAVADAGLRLDAGGLSFGDTGNREQAGTSRGQQPTGRNAAFAPEPTAAAAARPILSSLRLVDVIA